jgi:hypothetical protein
MIELRLGRRGAVRELEGERDHPTGIRCDEELAARHWTGRGRTDSVTIAVESGGELFGLAPVGPSSAT